MRGIVMALFFSTGACAQELVLSAPLEAVRSLTIRTEIAGQITSIHVQEGQSVAVGDTLIVLENKSLTLDARLAALEYKKSQAELHRARAMHKHGLISAEQLEATEFASRVMELHWLAIQIKMERLNICAPIDGMVSALSIKSGDWLSTQATVTCIIDPEDLQAHLYVPEDRLPDVTLGMPVRAAPVGSGDASFDGKIQKISPVIDADSGTCKVLALFPGAGKRVRPGALIEVTISDGQIAKKKGENHDE